MTESGQPAAISPSSPAFSPSPSPSPSPSGTAPTPAPLSDKRRAGLLLTLILGSLTALAPLSLDMYLPGLPEARDALGTSASMAQLTLTSCLLGLGLGQLIVGPMSDQLGRRRPLLLGMSCYVLASVACAFAPGIEVLLACRLLQGLAGAAGVVIARAVVRDLFDGLAIARFLSTLLLIGGAAPVLAPVIGGQLLRFTDWRGVFLVLAAIGAVLLLVVARWLPETLPAERRDTGGLTKSLGTMAGLVRDRVFIGYLLCGGLSFGALFAYISASSFVVQEIYGASAQTYSLLFMVNAMGMVAVSQLNGRLLIGRISLNAGIAAGLVLLGLASAALLVMTSGLVGDPGLAALSVGLFVLMSAVPLVLPNANSQGLMRTPHAAGAASALLGASQFFIGAIASPLVGIAGEDTALPMAIVQVVAVLLATLSFLLLCRPRRRTRQGAAAPTLAR